MLRTLLTCLLLAIATGCSSMAPTLTETERSGSHSIVILAIKDITDAGIKPHALGNLVPIAIGSKPTGIALDIEIPEVPSMNTSETKNTEPSSSPRQTNPLDLAIAEAVVAASPISASLGQPLPGEQAISMAWIREQLTNKPNTVVVTLAVRTSITNKLNQARIDVVQKAYRACLPSEPSDCLDSSPERAFSFVSPVHTPKFANTPVKIRTDEEINAELAELERKRDALIDANASDERTKRR